MPNSPEVSKTNSLLPFSVKVNSNPDFFLRPSKLNKALESDQNIYYLGKPFAVDEKKKTQVLREEAHEPEAGSPDLAEDINTPIIADRAIEEGTEPLEGIEASGVETSSAQIVLQEDQELEQEARPIVEVELPKVQWKEPPLRGETMAERIKRELEGAKQAAPFAFFPEDQSDEDDSNEGENLILEDDPIDEEEVETYEDSDSSDEAMPVIEERAASGELFTNAPTLEPKREEWRTFLDWARIFSAEKADRRSRKTPRLTYTANHNRPIKSPIPFISWFRTRDVRSIVMTRDKAEQIFSDRRLRSNTCVQYFNLFPSRIRAMWENDEDEN